jgi:hypothetical protein
MASPRILYPRRSAKGDHNPPARRAGIPIQSYRVGSDRPPWFEVDLNGFGLEIGGGWTADPSHYQVLAADRFDDDLAVIEAALRSRRDARRHEQVNQAIRRLDDLRRDPRHPRHWTQRILVYQDQAGQVLWRDRVADDAHLDEKDLSRIEYVIEDPFDDEDTRSRRQWGSLFTFYKVDDDDRKVILMSIHLVETP